MSWAVDGHLNFGGQPAAEPSERFQSERVVTVHPHEDVPFQLPDRRCWLGGPDRLANHVDQSFVPLDHAVLPAPVGVSLPHGQLDLVA